MRMRFCATMRRPAFSIRALMAPVRLRAVASGLMIENVRSIAIDGHPLQNTGMKTAALIAAPSATSKARRDRHGRSRHGFGDQPKMKQAAGTKAAAIGWK